MFFNNPLDFLAGIPALLLAITFHEYAHGKMAAILGDPTPASQGRLTLNPLAHLDVLGTLMLLVAGFGWAKPVQVNPYHFRGDRQRGMMQVGLAGPVMNLVLAYLGAVAFRVFGGGSPLLQTFFWFTLWYNSMLAVFNLIPLPPLDGSKVLAGILPRRAAESLYSLEAYGPMILLLLLATGILGRFLSPAVRGLMSLIATASGFGT